MTKVRTGPDCGNSPKNRCVLDLTVAMARGDRAKMTELLTEDVHWLAIGRQPIDGIEAFIKAVCRYAPASVLTVEHVVSHGRAGAVNGVIEFGDNRRAFCHMYEFSSARGRAVKSLTSYSIRLD